MGDKLFEIIRKLLIFWILLQIPRLIAVPLISDIIHGVDSPAWMYPAILDIVVALPSAFIAFGIWKKKGLGIWTITVVYLVVSIIDHGDAVTAAILTGTPQVFSKMGSNMNPSVVPSLQAILDLSFLYWMTKSKTKKYFLSNIQL